MSNGAITAGNAIVMEVLPIVCSIENKEDNSELPVREKKLPFLETLGRELSVGGRNRTIPLLTS